MVKKIMSDSESESKSDSESQDHVKEEIKQQPKPGYDSDSIVDHYVDSPSVKEESK